MLTRYRERRDLARQVAQQGKGIPIPYSGKRRWKPGPKWFETMEGNFRRWWRAKYHTKINNRDIRALRDDVR